MTEQFLDVRGSARIIRRSWQLVLVFVLAGVVGGGAYLATALPRYRATALVLLSSTSVADSTSASAARPVETDAKVATSAAVLSPAGREADPSATLSELESSVTAAPDTTGVLKITGNATTPRRAERLANAVASHLVLFLTSNGAEASSSLVAGLHVEERQLETQLNDVKKEVAAVKQRVASEGRASSAGKQDTALLSNLTSEEAGVNLQLSSVRGQIFNAQLGDVSAAAGTEVIQRARSATPPSALSTALPLIIGVLAGALAGSLLVLARNRARPRVWSRDALARELGAPVVLSLAVARRRSVGDWVTLLEQHEPDALETWSVKKALRELGLSGGEPLDLVVTAFAQDAPAVTAAVQLAVTASASGVATELGVVGTERAQPALQAACGRYASEDRLPRGALRVRDADVPRTGDPADLSVTVVMVDAGDPAHSVDPSPAHGVGVASVSAGFASAGQLVQLTVAASACGPLVKGTLVANPDAHDETLGRFRSLATTTSLDDHRRQALSTSGAGKERTR